MFRSHINQKTQFENPVLEAKKKLSQETAAIQQAAAAPSQGNTQHCGTCLPPHRACEDPRENTQHAVTAEESNTKAYTELGLAVMIWRGIACFYLMAQTGKGGTQEKESRGLIFSRRSRRPLKQRLAAQGVCAHVVCSLTNQLSGHPPPPLTPAF